MIDFESVFIDTAPVIYCLENEEHYGDLVISFLERHPRARYVTSVITIAEYFPHPFRQPNRNDYVAQFNEFINRMNIEIVEIDRMTAELSAEIRTSYAGIKGMDSLQIASAIQHNCAVLLTNERQLRQVKEITCLTLDEWKESCFE